MGTTTSGRPNSALIVVDMQNEVVANAYDRDGVIANINALVQRARSENVPVVWVQHTDDDLAVGSEGWQFVPELRPRGAEPLIAKSFGDSFEDTTLESVLDQLGVGRLIVTGAQTDQCIRSTIHGAVTRGYDTFLVSDAHTTDDYSEHGLPSADKVIMHTNYYWLTHEAPGRETGTVDTAAVSFTAN